MPVVACSPCRCSSAPTSPSGHSSAPRCTRCIVRTGPLAAAAVVIAAGGYELTPLKRHFRRRCRESVRSGFEFGLCCVGSSIGLMLMLVVLGVMSVTWMAVIAVVVLAQKLLPAKAVVDVPLALAIVGLGIWIAVAPASVPGLMPHDVKEEKRMTSHTTGSREEWLAARLELLEAEKELTRRSDEAGPAAAGAARGFASTRSTSSTPTRAPRHSPICSEDARNCSSTTSCSDPTTGRLPVLLGNRRRLQRLRRPPGQPRRHALGGVAGAAGETAGVQAADGLERSRGRPRTDSDFNYDFQVTHTTRSGSREPSSTTSAPSTSGCRRPTRIPSSLRSRPASERTGRPTVQKGPA